MESNRVQFIRSKYFKFGELIFDYKCKKLRTIKILRQMLQSLLKSIIYTFILDKKKLTVNFGYLIGILNFVVFYLKKKLINE